MRTHSPDGRLLLLISVISFISSAPCCHAACFDYDGRYFHIAGQVEPPGTVLDVAIAGTNAYLATGGAGMSVVDVSDPLRPRVTGSLYATGIATGVVTRGSYAYLAESDQGFRVIMISDPGNLITVSTLDTPGQALDLAVSGRYLYVADGWGGLVVADVGVPAHPFMLGAVPLPDQAVGVAISGAIGYVAARTSGLLVVDTSDPANPQIFGQALMPGIAEDVAVQQNLAYVADGLAGLQIVDVTDPAQPTVIGSIAVGDAVTGVSVVGSRAYLAGGASGLHVIDVSDPSSPRAVARLDAHGNVRRVIARNDYAYVSNNLSGFGFQIADLSSNEQPGVLESLMLPGGQYMTAQGDYAYLADFNTNTLRIVDISSPTSFRLVSELSGTPWINGISIAGHLVYLACLDRVEVVDVSDPEVPIHVSSIDIGGGTALPPVGAESGPYVYVLANYGGVGDIFTYDMSDPSRPLRVDEEFIYDGPWCATRTGTSLCLANHHSFSIYDVSNPAHPVAEGELGTGEWDPTSIAAANGYAYVGFIWSGSPGIRVLRVEGQPTFVGTMPLGSNFGMAVSGDRLYTLDGSGYSGPMRVIDVADGSHPRIAGELPGSWWLIGAGSQHAVLWGSTLYTLDLVPAQCGPVSGTELMEALQPTILRVWPNPAGREGVTLRLVSDRGGPMRLAIHDAAGRLVRRILDGVVAPGMVEWRWDGRDESGRPVASGTYFVNSAGAGRSDRRALIILR